MVNEHNFHYSNFSPSPPHTQAYRNSHQSVRRRLAIGLGDICRAVIRDCITDRRCMSFLSLGGSILRINYSSTELRNSRENDKLPDCRKQMSYDDPPPKEAILCSIYDLMVLMGRRHSYRWNFDLELIRSYRIRDSADQSGLAIVRSHDLCCS